MFCPKFYLFLLLMRRMAGVQMTAPDHVMSGWSWTGQQEGRKPACVAACMWRLPPPLCRRKIQIKSKSNSKSKSKSFKSFVEYCVL